MRPVPRVMPAIVTPFGPDGEIDAGGHADNVARLWDRGVAGAVIAGSNGEGPYLEPGERRLLAATARRAAPNGFVAVGLSAESLRGAQAMTTEAVDADADAILVITPTTLVRGNDALVEGFYTDVADWSPLPVFLYSVPKITGYELPLAVAIRLAEHRNVVGMKDSGGDPARAVAIAAAAPAGFVMLAGASAAVAAAVAGGAYGAVTASANYAPELVAAVVSSAGADPGLHRRLVQLSAAVERHGVAGVKYAASRTGLVGGHSRLPLQPISPEAATEIDAALAAAAVQLTADS